MSNMSRELLGTHLTTAAQSIRFRRCEVHDDVTGNRLAFEPFLLRTSLTPIGPDGRLTMALAVPTVEQRLSVTLAYLETLRRQALLVEQAEHIPLLSSRRTFAEWVANMARITAAEVASVRAALPSECRLVDAPFVRGAR